MCRRSTSASGSTDAPIGSASWCYRGRDKCCSSIVDADQQNRNWGDDAQIAEWSSGRVSEAHERERHQADRIASKAGQKPVPERDTTPGMEECRRKHDCTEQHHPRREGSQELMNIGETNAHPLKHPDAGGIADEDVRGRAHLEYHVPEIGPVTLNGVDEHSNQCD